MKKTWGIVFGFMFLMVTAVVWAAPSCVFGSFIEFQSIPTQGACDWESFTINGDTYLAVANWSIDVTQFNVDSLIYRFNGVSFVEYQRIPTHSAHDLESFVINGETYLVVANHQIGSTNAADSVIYKWNGTAFGEFQKIKTIGAIHWESIKIDGQTYLAVANMYAGYGDYNGNSVVYKWNDQSMSFIEYQKILSHGAMYIHSFAIDHISSMVTKFSWISIISCAFQASESPAAAESVTS